MRRGSFAITLGLWLMAAVAQSQGLPPTYDPGTPPESATEIELRPDSPPLPPGYLEHEPPEVAPDPSAISPEEAARIRAMYERLRDEGKRYRLGYPVVMGGTSAFSLSYAAIFLIDEKDDFFGMPDPDRLRRYRAWLGVSTLMVASAITWLVLQVIGRREWKRRFLPVREMYEALPPRWARRY